MDARLDRLAALLRERPHWRPATAGALADLIDQSAAEPAPAEYWIGPFPWAGGTCPWAGGPCPLPPDVRIDGDTLDGGGLCGPANMFNWGHGGDPLDIVSFSYRADNEEGWIKLPRDFAVPITAYPLAVRDEAGRESTWMAPPSRLSYITHIRLLPREAKAATPPPPDVVREALEAFIAEKADYMERNRLGNPDRQHTIKLGRAALAALDAREPETLPHEPAAGMSEPARGLLRSIQEYGVIFVDPKEHTDV